MANMKNIILGACAILSVAQAAPFMHTVTDIVTETVWETIDATTTVWRPINESPAVTITATISSNTTISTSTSVPETVLSSTITSDYVAPVQATPSATTPAVTDAASPTPTATSAIVVAAVAPVETPSTVAVSTSASAVVVAAAVATAATSVQGSATTDCEGQGSACTGDITYWDGGLGACGWNVDTNNDLSIALPVGLMGSQSNGNPYCGRSVTVLDPATGITVQATVGDKCMGCVDRAIDCTDKLFNAVTGGTGDGRVHGIEWWFT